MVKLKSELNPWRLDFATGHDTDDAIVYKANYASTLIRKKAQPRPAHGDVTWALSEWYFSNMSHAVFVAKTGAGRNG